jgi:thiamine pyrophosphate-dependent acetolactate synthase large subunit-like protein
VLTIVGAHATGHVRYDAPLQSDIEALARTVSGWVHTCGTTRGLAEDAMRAVSAASRGQIATLVLPADVSWGEGGQLAVPRPWPGPEAVSGDQVSAAAATGAAVAAPHRPVVALEADGSALYTIQALWTQAREQLNVTTVLINNAAYAILRMELARTAAGRAGQRASRMLDLSGPTPDFT